MVKRKEIKLYAGIIGAVALLLILGAILLFVFIPQEAVQPIYKGFTQWTGTACGSLQCDYLRDGKMTISSIAEFNTGANSYRFEVQPQGYGQCGEYNDGRLIQVCCLNVDVYKNNEKIDTIKWGYGGTKSSENSQARSWTYYDDGEKCRGICQPTKMGVGIDLLEWSSFLSGCQNTQNGYDILFPEGSVTMNMTPLNKEYTQGDKIEVKAVFESKVINSSGKLKIVYEVPTVIGTATKTDEYDVNLSLGESIFLFNLPSDRATDLLRFKPTLTIQYPTDLIKGVNHDFGTGTLKPLTTQPFLTLGTIEGNWTEVTILPKERSPLSSIIIYVILFVMALIIIIGLIWFFSYRKK